MVVSSFDRTLVQGSYGDAYETIEVAKFNEQCLSILDHLSHDGLLITKLGKHIARVLPFLEPSELLGSLKDKVKIHGDLMSTDEKWNAKG